MAYGNNRAAARPQASFQAAGGTIIKFRHPFLAGQISNASPVDEIDVSRCLKLNEEFFNAAPTQDSSFQETLVDGSVITITNHLLNGVMNLRALSTTGFVGTGDFLAALHLIKASKDDIGGTLTVIQNINGKRRVTIFYGVSCKQVPDLIISGNVVPVYPVQLGYAGWIQGASANMDINAKTIWAVGNKNGISAVYKPYAIQKAENESNFYGGSPISSSTTGVDTNDGDSATGDVDTVAAIPATMPDGMSDTPTPSQVTWSS
jgi:hypothetical protein